MIYLAIINTDNGDSYNKTFYDKAPSRQELAEYAWNREGKCAELEYYMDTIDYEIYAIKERNKFATVEGLKGRTTSFKAENQTAFMRISSRTMRYFPRYWIVNNKEEYMDLLNYLCQIDLIVHPEVVAYPQKYQLINENNSPVLVPISEDDNG
jgi:hypothetical protein